MVGWTLGRKHYKHEDRRWNLWREHWTNGDGLLGIRNVHINFFVFYQMQALSNVWVFSLPLILMCNNTEETLYKTEILGLIIWAISFYLENVADIQLSKFQLKNKGNINCVMDKGLWRYSRHSNYFFEWMIWNSYALMTFYSINSQWQYAILILMPAVAFYFLVFYTGVPMAEKNSLKRRGEIYRKYQENTSMFIPWFSGDNSFKSE